MHDVINATELYIVKIMNFYGNLISVLDREQTTVLRHNANPQEFAYFEVSFKIRD